MVRRGLLIMTKILAKIISIILTAIAKTIFLPIALVIFIYQYYRGVPPKLPDTPQPQPEPKTNPTAISILKSVAVHKGIKATWH